MEKRILVPTLLLTVLIFAVPLASARIVPQKGIQGIYLGKTPAEVVDRKGMPDKEKVVENEIVGKQLMMKYGMTKVYFSGTRKKSEAISVQTRDPGQRTDNGVGIGSTKREVKKGVEGVKCETVGGFHHCYKGAFRPGKRVTDFILNKDKKVKHVRVGIVID